jgi:predicted nucleic acid-binding protein
MPTFADTTVLNNFAQIRRPDLLSLAYPDLSAPASVWNELDLGVRRGTVAWPLASTLENERRVERHVHTLVEVLELEKLA